MKKIIIAMCMVFVLIASAGFVVSGKNQQQKQDKKFSLPENAVEVSKGVYYLGETMDKKGRIVDEYLYVHYAKDSNRVKKVKPVEDSSCYGFIAKDMELKGQPEYFINVDSGYLGESEMVDGINNAITEWNTQGFDIFGSYSGESTAGFVGDGQNTLLFGDYDVSGVIAVCSVRGIFRGPPANRQITEFDIMFDTDFNWGDATTNAEVMDLQNIATHELGHAVGLGDLYNTECNTQTMYGYSGYGDISKRTLESGDIAGLNILYA